jgi:hypothetical protein
MKQTFLLSVILLLIIIGCKKTVVNPTTTITRDTTIIIHHDTTIIVNNDTTITQGDQQIRFSLPGTQTYDTAYIFSDPLVNIQKFNIDYYPGVDSVFYVINSAAQNGNTGTIELWNFTDNLPIAGSLINVVSNEAGIFYHSGNIAAAIPHKEITVGIRVKSAVQGSYLNAVFGYLYLYRK